jgi:AdoMet-dependent heme synthase
VILSDIKLKEKTSFKIIGNKNYWTPDIISLELTHNCPLRCKHCYLNAGSTGEMMNDELLERICKESVELGINAIQITGGEPLLHPKVFDSIDYFLENNIEVDLFTSGFLCDDELLSKFKKYNGKNLIVQISLDGLEEFHNEFRGNKNSFKNALKFIKFLTSNNIRTIVATCITEQSYEDMEQLCLLVQEMGVSVLRLSTTSERGRAITNNIVSSNNKIQQLKSIQKDFSQKYNSNKFTVMYNEQTGVETNLKYVKNCGLGQTMLKVAPNGNVYPCIMCDLCMDNITNKSVKKILEQYSINFSQIEKPSSKYCNECESKELCVNCVTEGLLYGKKSENCTWYMSQKHIIDKIVMNS